MSVDRCTVLGGRLRLVPPVHDKCKTFRLEFMLRKECWWLRRTIRGIVAELNCAWMDVRSVDLCLKCF